MSRYLAQGKIDVPLAGPAASEALCAVLQDLGYTLEEGSVPGEDELIFNRKRSLMYVRRQGGARITDTGDGSTIELGVDVAPGEPTGLMDGKRNRRLIEELTEKVSAVGSA